MVNLILYDILQKLAVERDKQIPIESQITEHPFKLVDENRARGSER